MALKPLLQQLLIWTSISAASAYQVHLTSEVSAFIPGCAQTCVENFIEDNYLSTACGTSPTLQCLCSHHTPFGFTIGEGAVECIIGENQLGACQENEASPSIVNAAYNMCSGQASALPNTHPTLSATLIIPSSGPGVVIVAPPPTTTVTTTISSSAVTSSVRSTITTMPIITSQRTSTTVPPSFTTSITSLPNTSTTAFPVTPGAATSTPLGTAQIAGISVGVAGAIILALGAILLARRVRRRKYPELDDDGFYPMDEKSSIAGGGFGGAAARLTKIFHISPPILRPQQRGEPQLQPQAGPEYTISPTDYNLDRNTIGLAISRPRSEIQTPKRDSRRDSTRESAREPSTLQRRPSKLLPPKPLRPIKPALTLNIPSAIHPALRPQSSQPQTDRTSTMTNMTAFADLDSEAAEGAQIWRPPPTDPQSATTYYVADKWGNWVLSNNNRQSELAQVAEAAELDTYTPMTKSPIEKKEEAARMAAAISAATTYPGVSRPEPAFLKIDPADAGVSRSSSVYSQASAVRPAVRPTAPPASRSNSSGRRGPSRSDSKDSRDSATTMDTSSSSGGGPFDEDAPMEVDVGHLSMLSPVVESPRSPTTGRSPVTYPRIPGRLDGATIRHVPPPKFPNFTTSPPGQPSPTLGAVLPVRSSPSAYPQPLNPRRASVRNRPIPPSQATGSGFSPVQPSKPVFPVPPLNTSPRSDSRQPPRIDTRQPPRTHISSFISPASATTISSAASSLLAKRVGNEKAAALSLENGRQKPGGWKRRDPTGEPSGGTGLLSPEMAGMMTPRMGLPSTPTWQPKLTPTRRGDDLFLNVQ